MLFLSKTLMSDQFAFDVFLSYSPKDKDIVRPLAERLRNDGIRVWFDEWEIKPGDRKPAKIDDGLERSRALVLCMSAHAFGPGWAALEKQTFRFRDLQNKDRKFIPLQLDDASIKGSLSQFLYISWLPAVQEQEYAKLLEACRFQQPAHPETKAPGGQFAEKVYSLGHTDAVRTTAVSPDGKYALSGSDDHTVRVWEVSSGRAVRVLEGHSGYINSVAFSADGKYALSGSDDKTVRVWDVESGRTKRVLEGHFDTVRSVAFSADSKYALSGSDDKTVRVWDVESGRTKRVLEGHSGGVNGVAFGTDGKYALSGSDDKTVRVWDVESGRTKRVLEGHSDGVWSVAFSTDGKYALSGSDDKTVRVWEVESGRTKRVLEGHFDTVRSVAFSADSKYALSGSDDKTVRVWEVGSGRVVRLLTGHARVGNVAFSADGNYALSGSYNNAVQVWEVGSGRVVRLLTGHRACVRSVAFRADGKYALSGSDDETVRVWDVRSGRAVRVLAGDSGVQSVAFSADGKYALSGSDDTTVRVWEVSTRRVVRVLAGHSDTVWSVAFSMDGKYALSGSDDKTVRVWEVGSGLAERVLEGHIGTVRSVAFSADGKYTLSGSDDNTVRVWDVGSGRAVRVLEGHNGGINSVVFSADGKYALSGSNDNTVRLWDVGSGRAERVLEGHHDGVNSVAFSADGKYALSGSEDNTVRLWEVASGRVVRVLEGHSGSVRSVAFSADGRLVFSAAHNGVLRVWEIGKAGAAIPLQEQVSYTIAKVLLVGDSGVGKTGLARYLALNLKDEGRNSSTDGAWATQWTLPHQDKQQGVDREIVLWDFAGQVDYRLVHQLFMDDTTVAVLVFNPQNQNPFDGLRCWDGDLQKAARGPFVKLLVAGRIDRGGLMVSRASLERFMEQRGFRGQLYETSAMTGEGCDALRDAIIQAIDWKAIPVINSPVLFHRMKLEILKLMDEGPALITQGALEKLLVTRLGKSFMVEALEIVLYRLSGHGMITCTDFGSSVLFRPDVLSRYAAAMVRKVRKHPQELGCITEVDMLAGALDYQDFERLPQDQEAVVLRALHKTLVSRAWCLRQVADGQTLLTFPSYFRRERPERPGRPNAQVTYRFAGPIDDIYATLVVRLHYTQVFETDQLWQYAADFKTQTGTGLGVKLAREAEGSCRIDLYFDADVDENSRLVFDRYVRNHLIQHAQEVKRLRHYACGNRKCKAFGQPFGDRATIDAALKDGDEKIACPRCGKPILLLDAMEKKFASPQTDQQARQMDAQTQQALDNESLELLLVGHAFVIAAEAGQIYRGYTNSDHGIDGEIEFKDDENSATGKRLYLQLKSGDSYLKTRQRDGAEIFQIKKARWAAYWQEQAYPVMLVIRNSRGEIRWMDISAYLQRAGSTIKQIVFEGERFDAMSVRRWRDRVLSKAEAQAATAGM